MPPAKQLDVAVVQAGIEQIAREAGMEPPFPLLHLQRLQPILAEAVHVEPNPTLLGRTRYERVWAVINRALRRIARYGVEPVVTQQNAFNAQVERTLSHLTGNVVVLHAETVRLCARSKHGRR
jgi:hypothetical protein